MNASKAGNPPPPAHSAGDTQCHERLMHNLQAHARASIRTTGKRCC
jgi:hypothetical protein